MKPFKTSSDKLCIFFFQDQQCVPTPQKVHSQEPTGALQGTGGHLEKVLSSACSWAQASANL